MYTKGVFTHGGPNTMFAKYHLCDAKLNADYNHEGASDSLLL